jgi:hypothetical protein
LAGDVQDESQQQTGFVSASNPSTGFNYAPSSGQSSLPAVEPIATAPFAISQQQGLDYQEIAQKALQQFSVISGASASQGK